MNFQFTFSQLWKLISLHLLSLIKCLFSRNSYPYVQYGFLYLILTRPKLIVHASSFFGSMHGVASLNSYPLVTLSCLEDPRDKSIKCIFVMYSLLAQQFTCLLRWLFPEKKLCFIIYCFFAPAIYSMSQYNKPSWNPIKAMEGK